jgi:hypothetical protein
VASNEMAFIDKLWRDWSPGYQPGDHLARVKESLREPANLAAAIGYHRAAGPSRLADGSAGRARLGTARRSQ